MANGKILTMPIQALTGVPTTISWIAMLPRFVFITDMVLTDATSKTYLLPKQPTWKPLLLKLRWKNLLWVMRYAETF